jgi:hypothetical protein
MRAIHRHLFAALFISLATAAGVALLGTLSPERPGDLVVAFAPTTPPERALAAITQSGATVRGEWLGGRLWHVSAIDDGTRRQLAGVASFTLDARYLEPLVVASGCGWVAPRPAPRSYSAA